MEGEDSIKLLVADCDNRVVRIIDGDEVKTWAGDGDKLPKDGPKLLASFPSPQQIIGVKGTYFITDYYAHSLRMITPDGMVSSIGKHRSLGFGLFSKIGFKCPKSLALLDENTLLVTNNTEDIIHALNLVDMSSEFVAGRGRGSELGKLTESSFHCLYSLTAIPNSRNVLAADHYNNRVTVLAFDANQVVTLLDNKVGGPACFPLKEPTYVTLTPKGDLFFTEWSGKLRSIKGFIDPGLLKPPKRHQMSGLSDLWLNPSISDTEIRISDFQEALPLHMGLMKLCGLDEEDLMLIQHDKVLHKSAREFFEILYGVFQPSDIALSTSQASALLQVLHTAHKVKAQALGTWIEQRIYRGTAHYSTTELVQLLFEMEPHLEQSTSILNCIYVQLRRIITIYNEGLAITPLEPTHPHIPPELVSKILSLEKPTITFEQHGRGDYKLFSVEIMEKFAKEHLSWKSRSRDLGRMSTAPSLPNGANDHGTSLKTFFTPRDHFDKEHGTNFSITSSTDSSEAASLELRVHDLVLYSRWSYFRRLIDSGMEEARSKIASFPTDFPRPLLLQIVYYLYTGTCDTSSLSFQDLIFLFTDSGQYGLIQIDGTATPEFSSFVTACKQKLLPHINISNCISNFKAQLILGSDKSIRATADFISANRASIPSTPESEEVFGQLAQWIPVEEDVR
jgi:hypothetical protein